VKQFQTYASFRKIVKHNPNKACSSYLDLQPIQSPGDEDIFIVGFPKSGNTWMQNLLVEMAYGINSEKISDALLQELVPDVHFKRYYKRLRDTMFFKSHFLPLPEYKRVIYIVRDGRDAMVSYYHYLNAIGNFKGGLDDLVKCQNLFPSRWSTHVEAWLDNPYESEMLIIRYEDLLTEPNKVIKKIVDFSKITATEDAMSTAIKRTSFSRMQKKEKNIGWDRKRKWPDGKLFVRSGTQGSFKKEMSEAALKYFEEDSRQALQRCGYIS